MIWNVLCNFYCHDFSFYVGIRTDAESSTSRSVFPEIMKCRKKVGEEEEEEEERHSTTVFERNKNVITV